MTDGLAAEVAAMFDVSDVRAVDGGHQALVFTAVRADGPLIVKAIDAAFADPAHVLARITMVEALADLEPHVCRPIRHEGRFVHELHLPDGGSRLVTLWEYAPGREPDPRDPEDAALMGTTLARLHAAMAVIDPIGVAPVASYRNQPTAPSWQLLHGDFNAANMRLDGDTVRVFDFDDCGLGPIEFDIANAIYMVLFDCHITQSPSVAQRFRVAFLDGYSERSGITIAGEVIDREIDRRVDALAGWLDNPETAPIGIRTSTDEWKAVLRAFAKAHQG